MKRGVYTYGKDEDGAKWREYNPYPNTPHIRLREYAPYQRNQKHLALRYGAEQAERWVYEE